ncbi:hypothetical protein ACTFIV_000865 [Dictyostelium citrinum]
MLNQVLGVGKSAKQDEELIVIVITNNATVITVFIKKYQEIIIFTPSHINFIINNTIEQQQPVYSMRLDLIGSIEVIKNNTKSKTHPSIEEATENGGNTILYGFFGNSFSKIQQRGTIQ